MQEKDTNPSKESNNISYGLFLAKDFLFNLENDMWGLHFGAGFQKLSIFNNIDSKTSEANSYEVNIGASGDLFGFILGKITVGNALLNFNRKINNDFDSKFSFFLELAAGIHFTKVAVLVSFKEYNIGSYKLSGYNTYILYYF